MSSLKDKAIDIKGKNYVLVSDRIIYFNENYPNGSITTKLISDWNSDLIVIKSTVIPDIEKPLRKFTGYSQAVVGQGMVNKTAALENAETSAVGRALGMIGIGVIDSVASADEMKKSTWNNKYPKYIKKPSDNINSDLNHAKIQLVNAFTAKNITKPEEMRLIIEDVLGVSELQTVYDAERVIEHLEGLN